MGKFKDKFYEWRQNRSEATGDTSDTGDTPDADGEHSHTVRNFIIGGGAVALVGFGLATNDHFAASNAADTASAATTIGGYSPDTLNTGSIFNRGVTGSLGRCGLGFDTKTVGGKLTLYPTLTLPDAEIVYPNADTTVETLVREYPECVVVNYEDLSTISPQVIESWRKGDEFSGLAGSVARQNGITDFTLQTNPDHLVGGVPYKNMATDCEAQVNLGADVNGVIYGTQVRWIGGKPTDPKTIPFPTAKVVEDANIAACAES